ncbi:MAG: hypothetical protein EA393_04115 [Bacteroidetes bacterium]|nr:MAG: hypothetical protein EA393_04115 [Bacteroidota bacterium]
MTQKSAKRFTITIVLVIVISSVGFFILFPPKDRFHIDRYIPKEEQDTLLVNIVTLMGVKPRNTNYITRHEPRYRNFYIQQARDFYIYRYYVDENELHYFYIIRPARHPFGNRRAIGGKYRLGVNLELQNYQEVFVTQILQEEYLREIADDLFIALTEGNIEKYLDNRLIIEWPDDRLKYDKEKQEWRYDVKVN